MSKVKIEITVEMGNAAVQTSDEAMAIAVKGLQRAASEGAPDCMETRSLLDLNGNKVGKLKIEVKRR